MTTVSTGLHFLLLLYDIRASRDDACNMFRNPPYLAAHTYRMRRLLVRWSAEHSPPSTTVPYSLLCRSAVMGLWAVGARVRILSATYSHGDGKSARTGLSSPSSAYATRRGNATVLESPPYLAVAAHCVVLGTVAMPGPAAPCSALASHPPSCCHGATAVVWQCVVTYIQHSNQRPTAGAIIIHLSSSFRDEAEDQTISGRNQRSKNSRSRPLESRQFFAFVLSH